MNPKEMGCEHGCGLNSCGQGYGPVAGSGEKGNEPYGSIKSREFFDQQSGCQLLRKVFLCGISYIYMYIC
jgi:hypothetical protein